MLGADQGSEKQTMKSGGRETLSAENSLVAATWRPKKWLGFPTRRFERVRLVQSDGDHDGYYPVLKSTLIGTVAVDNPPDIVPVKIVTTGITRHRSEFTAEQLQIIAKSWGQFVTDKKR